MIFDPPSSTIIFSEGIGTSGTTVSITDDLGGPVNISSVVCSEQPSDLNISIGASQFTFSSLFDDVMNRQIRYTTRGSTSNVYGSVSKLSDLPAKYDVHHVSSPPDSKTIGFTVTLNSQGSQVENWYVTVESDLNRTIQIVRNAITGSQGRQEYLASRPNEPEQF